MQPRSRRAVPSVAVLASVTALVAVATALPRIAAAAALPAVAEERVLSLDVHSCFRRCSHNDDCGGTCGYCEPTTRTCISNPMCRWRCFTSLDCMSMPSATPSCQTCVNVSGTVSICLTAQDEFYCTADADCADGSRCREGRCMVPQEPLAPTCGLSCNASNAAAVCTGECTACVGGTCRAACGARCDGDDQCDPACGACATGVFGFPAAKFCTAKPDPTAAPTPAPTPVPTTTVTTTTTTAAPTTTVTSPPPTTSTTAVVTTTTGIAPTTTSTPPPTTTTASSTTAVPETTRSPDANRDASGDSASAIAIAAALPLGTALVLLVIAEAALRCCVRGRGRGNAVLGVDLNTDAALTVRLCVVNSRHTTAIYTEPVSARDLAGGGINGGGGGGANETEESSWLLHAAAASPGGSGMLLNESAPDALAACAVAAQYQRLPSAGRAHKLAGIAAVAPGTSFQHGALTNGSHTSVLTAISALVKAKRILLDDERGFDGSYAGVQVYAPSVALAGGCAATFREVGPPGLRAAQDATLHMAVHVTHHATTCVTYVQRWDPRGRTCWLQVCSDQFDAAPLDATQMSDASIGAWVRRALGPAVQRMLADARQLDPDAFEVPVALVGSRVTHAAVTDELSRHAILRVWYPGQHPAVDAGGILAFGAAVLAAGECPAPQIRVIVAPENALIPSVESAVPATRSPPGGHSFVPRVPSTTTVLTPAADDTGYGSSVGSSLLSGGGLVASIGRQNQASRRSTLSDDESGVALSSVGSCVSRSIGERTPTRPATGAMRGGSYQHLLASSDDEDGAAARRMQRAHGINSGSGDDLVPAAARDDAPPPAGDDTAPPTGR